ncbi:hypothetical protein ACOMHN_057926 [Nucella lapillus]
MVVDLTPEGQWRLITEDKVELPSKQFQSAFSTQVEFSQEEFHERIRCPREITLSGVVKILKNLDPSNASGPDGISLSILKINSWLIAYFLKKGEHYKVENYRPISLTSVPCKVMEHLIVATTMTYVND